MFLSSRVPFRVPLPVIHYYTFVTLTESLPLFHPNLALPTENENFNERLSMPSSLILPTTTSLCAPIFPTRHPE